MTLYRGLVFIAWLSWMWAIASSAEIFNVWIRIAAACFSAIGFGDLWRAQTRLPKILEKTKR